MEADKENLTALILDITADQRNKLKLLLTHIDFYDHIYMTDTTREAQNMLLQSDQAIDVFFLSCAYDPAKISELIEEAQKTRRTECAVFILLLTSSGKGERRIANVADAFMVGAHACLCEPYSVDNVREVTEHARKLRNRLREARDRTTIKLLLQAAMKHIDNVSQRMTLNTSPMQDLAKLREIGRSIEKLDRRLHDLYFEMAMTLFEKAELPFFLPGVQNYTGCSKAVQRRAAAKRAKLKESGPSRPPPPPPAPVQLPDGRVLPPKKS